MRKLATLTIASLAMLGATAVRADDAPKPKSIEDIKTIVTNMGYDVTMEGDAAKISVNSNYNYPVYFTVNGDQSYLTVFTILGDLPVDKIARMPAVSLLQFNDTHYNYMSLNKREGNLRFVMQNTLPPGAATPQILRQIVSHLIEDANGSDTLWNTAKWN